jgi:serine/threonine protein kinase
VDGVPRACADERRTCEPLAKRAPRLDADGIDLVTRLLLYDTRKRITANLAIAHDYFSSLGLQVHTLTDSK